MGLFRAEKIRSTIIFDTGKLFKIKANKLIEIVCGKCIHSYSLIHDDLPCMDRLNSKENPLHIKNMEKLQLCWQKLIINFTFEIISSDKSPLLPKQKNEIIKLLSTVQDILE